MYGKITFVGSASKIIKNNFQTNFKLNLKRMISLILFIIVDYKIDRGKHYSQDSRETIQNVYIANVRAIEKLLN